MPDRRVLRLTIHGRVQGVGFRAWLEGEAVDRGVDGWVRNRRDGSVEALLAGDPDAVDALRDACRRGPRGARVERIDGEAATLAPGDLPIGFRVLPTA